MKFLDLTNSNLFHKLSKHCSYYVKHTSSFERNSH